MIYFCKWVTVSSVNWFEGPFGFLFFLLFMGAYVLWFMNDIWVIGLQLVIYTYFISYVSQIFSSGGGVRRYTGRRKHQR